MSDLTPDQRPLCDRNASPHGARHSILSHLASRRSSRWLPLVAFASACLCFAITTTTLAADNLARPDVRRDATVAAVEKVMPSVVNIGTLTVARADPYEQMLREFFGYGNRAPDTLYSSGSGVIIDDEGWVLTNFHVVREAAKVQVTLADTTEPIDAEVVATSEVNDLAVLRLKGKPGQKFRGVPFAPDDDLLLGETVLAMGNPYGLGGSVSRGILSSKTRRSERDGEAMEPEDWLQTDASINPGNSGGPLVNLRGELIGLNVAILARAQGIGFAIPAKRISTALAEMLSPETTRGLWFGATVRGSRPPVVIQEIQRGSPADNAGLEPGDEILSVNGKTTKSFLQLYRELDKADRDNRLVVLRGDDRKEIKLRLVAETAVFNSDYLRRRLGLTVEKVPDDLRVQLRLSLNGALLVSTIDRGGPAERAGMSRGQIITAIDGQPPGDPVALGRALNRRRAGETVTFDLVSARRRGMLLQLSEGRAALRLR
ncbi:MAG: trypsin-like peptidase domain-containing protein [Verrucomicrobiales bacterium]|nr:trypsin-like peptidase domain-containing protein [Verrucomicrobiales bacterium]